MATNRRDIELLISAKETTGRSFQQVTQNIRELNDTIAEQIVQAEKGELSLQELRRTQEQLAQAGRDLSSIQGQIDAYNRLVATQDKVGSAAAKAKADLAALQAEVEAAGKSTAAQEAKMQRLEVAVTRTSAAVDKNTADITEQVAVLQRAGVAVDQLDTAQAGIIKTAHQIGAGMVQVNAAIDGYTVNVQRARQAEADLAAQQGFERKIAEAQRLGDASRFVRLFSDAIQTVNTGSNQDAALAGFRAVGQMAAEAANDVERFKASAGGAAVSTQQLAAGLRAILDPGGAALNTLSGIEATLDAAEATIATNTKNVGQLNDAYNNLAAAGASIVRQGGLIDGFRQQEAAVAAATAEFEQAQAEVRRLGQAMSAADQPTEQLANDLKRAQTTLEQTGRALGQEEAKLATLTRELKDASLNTADLAGEQARLEKSATRVNTNLEQINTTLGRGGRKTNGLFGLKPNDLANLSFQLNDIFVSLASGQNPLIVLIQQGSQIGQLFPGLISTIARFAVAWAPVIVAVGAVVGVIAEMISQANQLDDFTKSLANAVGGDKYDPKAISEVSNELQRLGVSAEDAKKAIMEFVNEGLTTAQIEDYTKAAAEAAKVTGVDFKEAVDAQVAVLHGGMDAVIDLTSKTHTLTDADLDHTQALFDSGKAAEARQYALDKNKQVLDAMAHNSESIWSPAVRNLSTAWSNFASWLTSKVRPVLDGINQWLEDAARGVTFLTALLAGKDFKTAVAESLNVGKTNKTTGGANDQALRDRKFLAQLDEEFNDQKSMTKEERLRLAEVKARRQAQDAGVSKAAEDLAVAKARTAEEAKLAREQDARNKKGESARAKAARAEEAERKRREAAQQTLEQQLRQLSRAAFTGESASLEERLTAIDEKYQSLYDSIKKVRALGLNTTADGTDLATVEKQIEAQKDRLKAEETIKFYQEQAALLDKQRSAEIEKITDAQLRGAIGAKEATQQAAEINNRLSPQIVNAAQQALTIAKQIAGANPSPEMVSWIASLERIISGEGTNNIVAKVGLTSLDEQSGKLDTLLKQRDDLVKSYQTLGELGLRTNSEVRASTVAAYNNQAQAIKPVLDSLRQTIEVLHNTKDALTGLPVLTDTAYNTWLARLDAVNAGLKYTDDRIIAINQAAMNGIGQGVTNAFQTLGNTIVGLVQGTMSWGDALDSVLNAGLSLLGSFLSAIADVLVQMVALQAAKALIGGSTGGFGSLFFHGGGKVGTGGSRRKRTGGGSDSWVGAPKFHGGGGLGLKPGEYKAVLKRGEEVLTEDNPRHINNAGNDNGGGRQPAIQQTLLLSPDDIAGAMQGRAGQKSVLTTIRANKETIKQMLK